MLTLIFGILGGAAVVTGLWRLGSFPVFGIGMLAIGALCIRIAASVL